MVARVLVRDNVRVRLHQDAAFAEDVDEQRDEDDDGEETAGTQPLVLRYTIIVINLGWLKRHNRDDVNLGGIKEAFF